ncbi:hypothetical protein [Geobacter sp.]|uniref:hypothetical protein n=1 Tax=Geobacter sp. TaxID=46610 RepID=UPI00261C0721|nr:hypothetical protein [Geobacter sp.]
MIGASILDELTDMVTKLRSIRCETRFDLINKFKVAFGDDFDNLDFPNYETGGFVKGAAIRDAQCGCEIYERLGWENSDFGKAGMHKCGCKVFDEKVQAVDSNSGQTLAEIPYFIEAENGKTFSGYTDAGGRLPRIFTQNDMAAPVFLDTKMR